MKWKFILLTYLCIGVAFATDKAEPFANLPAQRKAALEKRLQAYVASYRTHNWNGLYDLVSDVAKGRIAKAQFAQIFKSTHQAGFSNYPDLLDFRPRFTVDSTISELDIYGCGEAQREGQRYKGIVVTHAVFEHDNWVFSGWSFTEFPNESCTMLANNNWQPHAMEWNQPLEELRNTPGITFHVDAPK